MLYPETVGVVSQVVRYDVHQRFQQFFRFAVIESIPKCLHSVSGLLHAGSLSFKRGFIDGLSATEGCVDSATDKCSTRWVANLLSTRGIRSNSTLQGCVNGHQLVADHRNLRSRLRESALPAWGGSAEMADVFPKSREALRKLLGNGVVAMQSLLTHRAVAVLRH